MNLAGIPQYITHRVNYNFKCFYKTEDLQIYLNCLKILSQEEEVAVHAYALMSNRVHLLVTPRCKDSLPRMMELLGVCYTHYFNGEYCRKGDLWESGFRPCLIEAENYLISCQRFIELEPARAGLVDHPAEYVWSSYSINALGERSELVKPHEVYKALGINKAERIEAYRQLFNQELVCSLIDELCEHTNNGYCLGSVEFRLGIEAMLGRRSVRGRQGEPAKKIQLRSYH